MILWTKSKCRGIKTAQPKQIRARRGYGGVMGYVNVDSNLTGLKSVDFKLECISLWGMLMLRHHTVVASTVWLYGLGILTKGSQVNHMNSAAAMWILNEWVFTNFRKMSPYPTT